MTARPGRSRGQAHEYIVVGAGPAGLQLGYFFQKAGFDYGILEAEDAAGLFFDTFPRHRRLISINKLHTGRRDPRVQLRWDWNSLLNEERRLFRQYSAEYFPPAEAMVQYLQGFAAANQLNVHYNCPVETLAVDGDWFVLETPRGSYLARCVVVATGVSEPYVPGIEGIEHAATYATFDTTPERYANRRVLVIGKGNSGFETAESLIPYAAQIHVVGPHDVRHAWNSHHVGDLRAVNDGLIDTDHLKGQNATIWGEVKSIEPFRGQYKVRISHTDSRGRVFTHVYDDLICCTGFRMGCGIFDVSTLPELTLGGRFPRLTEAWESVNVAGLFFAGVLTQSRDYKRSSSAFVHGFRYNTRALFDILSRRRGVAWPSTRLTTSAECITNSLMERINTSSSLWHQFDFIADVIELAEPFAVHYFDVPIDYAVGSGRLCARPALMLCFTHRKPNDPLLHDVFSPEPALHPVVRLLLGGQVVSEHHVLEDLDAEWFEESLYIQPLEAYVSAALEEVAGART